jgi:hypothetical protein
MMFAESLAPVFTPARVEVRNETADDDQATLEVRGYFDEVFTGEPGWAQGTVTLLREEGGWKVDAESWGAPGSGEEDAPSGRFEVSGEVEGVFEEVGVSSPMWESYGGGWLVGLSDESTGYVVFLRNIPENLVPGEYPLTEQPSIPGDADPATLEFPPSVVFATESDTGGFDDTWDENVTGTLTVEAVENGKMSGRFEFTAEPFIGEPVTVRGSFRNVEVLVPFSAEEGMEP